MKLTKKLCKKILQKKSKYAKLLIQKAQQFLDVDANATTNRS